MLTKALTIFAVLCTLALLDGTSATSPQTESNAPKPVATPPVAPWPNLDNLTHFHNAGGTICGIDGAAQPGSEEAQLNRLRNRYHLPPTPFEEIKLKDLLDLPQGEISPPEGVINFPASTNPHIQRAVTLVGYVKEVQVLGCGKRPANARSLRPWGIESSNCNTNELGLCSTQILLTTDPHLSTRRGRNVFVVVVTERSRRLARSGRLSSSIGNNWSIDSLRRLKSHWVRFSGWLFFNSHYRNRSWSIDSDDTIGRPNVRETAWEIHPVIAIVKEAPPP